MPLYVLIYVILIRVEMVSSNWFHLNITDPIIKTENNVEIKHELNLIS